jgi:WD40 repeat protein
MRVLFLSLALFVMLNALQGPTHPISSLTSPSPGTFLAGSNDGRVTAFTTTDGAQPITGDSHRSQVIALAPSDNKVYSVGLDDTIRTIDVGESQFSYAYILLLLMEILSCMYNQVV